VINGDLLVAPSLAQMSWRFAPFAVRLRSLYAAFLANTQARCCPAAL